MDQHITDYFDDIIQNAQRLWQNIDYEINTTPERQILKLTAQYKQHRLFITELWSDQNRKYRCYLLRENEVIAGFDNAPDPRAIKMKYGGLSDHIGELVPHLHLKNKTELRLTDEMFFTDFLGWLENFNFKLN